MFFSWSKNKIKKFSNQVENNKSLIEELKILGIKQGNILSAIEKVPRKLFVEAEFIGQAYKNIPLPIDCGQTISQPYVVAYMISCLNLKCSDKVLEIGTGTGYQTAILSYLCKEVYSIEIYSKLLNKAKKRLEKLNLKNIFFKLGNGIEGWKSKVLFDAIIVSAASETVPIKLIESLKNRGSIIIPRKKSLENQRLLLLTKKNKSILKKELFSVKFVPLLNKLV